MMGIRQKDMCEFEKSILNAFGESGLTQVELASKSGVSQGLISLFIESDPSKRRTITLPVANRLCRVLGLELVQTKKMNFKEKKMIRIIPFRKNCNYERVKNLCLQPIKLRRGKMVCEQLLKELDSDQDGLQEKTRDWLSKWVNPARSEPKVEAIFEDISLELLGHRIARKI